MVLGGTFSGSVANEGTLSFAHSQTYGGTISGGRRIKLRVPPGVQDGAQLRVGGEGHDAGAGSIPGDLLVHVSVLEPPRDPRLVRLAALALLVIAAATLVLYVLR